MNPYKPTPNEQHTVKILAFQLREEHFHQYEAFFLPYISTKTKARVSKFLRKADAMRTLIGDILVRATLIQTYGIANKDISYEQNEYGKPYVKEYPSFHFNVTHSGEWVLAAFDNQPLGVDVEEIREIELSIANRYFTDTEIAYIMRGEVDQRLSRFYDLWTLKESYIKAWGTGLSMPLDSFSICINEQEGTIHAFDERAKEVMPYYLYQYNLDHFQGYKVALCTYNHSISPIEFLDHFDLQNRFIGRSER